MTTVNTHRVELICFGTELLQNKVNTNSVKIAELLLAEGLVVDRVTTVGDDASEVQAVLKECAERSEIVITCGGLGPTFDDLTRESVAEVLHLSLNFSEELYAKIRERFRSAGLKMPDENRKQAYVVGNAIPIVNNFGTAPGQIVETDGRCVILLPGPPRELLPMMAEAVCPYLRKKYRLPILKTLVLHIFGHPESEIDEAIDPVVRKDWNSVGLKVDFGILAHHSIIDVKFLVKGEDGKKVVETCEKIKSELNKILKEKVYGEDQQTMESVVGELLRKNKQSLSLAESCTGGLIAHSITNVPGSSDYFKESVVVYSNESKQRLLGVRKTTLEKYGAVSEPVAKEMVLGLLQRSKADWGIAVTGIAGPGGGTPEKPVGTVCFAVGNNKSMESFTRRFSGSRTEVKERSALAALNALRSRLP